MLHNWTSIFRCISMFQCKALSLLWHVWALMVLCCQNTICRPNNTLHCDSRERYLAELSVCVISVFLVLFLDVVLRLRQWHYWETYLNLVSILHILLLDWPLMTVNIWKLQRRQSRRDSHTRGTLDLFIFSALLLCFRSNFNTYGTSTQQR